MRPTLSLIRREIGAYFVSPIAYVVLVLFLLVTGYIFWLTLDNLTTTSPRGVTTVMTLFAAEWTFWLVFLLIPPLLTMRVFAEERSSGTLEMLLTAPLRDWQIVLSKFLACFGFYILLWLPTLLYLPVLLNWGGQSTIDHRPVMSSYLGFGLAGAMFLSIGMFISSLVKSQMVSAILSLAAGLPFVIFGFSTTHDFDPGDLLYRLQYFISVPMHFRQNFSQGLVDTRNLVLYISVTALCLFLTIRSLESRRWR
jgi:ABC-2 type transport system permease protein